MTYWCVQFIYYGPVGNPESHEPSRFCAQLDTLVERALKSAKLKYAHAYSYPDGSMYKYIKSNFYHEQLCGTIKNALKKENLLGNGEIDKDRPYKCISRIEVTTVVDPQILETAMKRIG
jgi:hypothetical protein